MIYDIVEAIEYKYGNDIDTVVEILMDLKENIDNQKYEYYIEEELESLGYCSDCGTKLEIIETQEVHTELDGNPIEYLYEPKCPNCDK